MNAYQRKWTSLWIIWIALKIRLFILALILPVQAAGSTDSRGMSYSKSAFGLYEIVTFDVYTDQQTIHVVVGGKPSEHDSQLAVRYIRSNDGGQHWTSPITVNTEQIEINAQRGNDIQLAVSGSRIVMLMQGKTELPGLGPMISIFSSDHGETWQRGSNPARDDLGSQAHIDLVTDHQGNFHAIWLEDPEEKGYQSLRYAYSADSGQRWERLMTIDDATCSCCWNTLVRSPQDQLNVLYRDDVPRDMALIQSTDGGTEWRRVSTVGEFGWQLNGCPQTGGSLFYNREDNVDILHSLVWTGMEQKAGLYHLASTDHGKTWSEPKRLGKIATNGDIAGHAHGLIAVWNELEATGTSVFYAETKGHGDTWSKPMRVVDAANAATQPRLAVTAQHILAFWTEKPHDKPSQLAWKIMDLQDHNNFFKGD